MPSPSVGPAARFGERLTTPTFWTVSSAQALRPARRLASDPTWVPDDGCLQVACVEHPPRATSSWQYRLGLATQSSEEAFNEAGLAREGLAGRRLGA